MTLRAIIGVVRFLVVVEHPGDPIGEAVHQTALDDIRAEVVGVETLPVGEADADLAPVRVLVGCERFHLGHTQRRRGHAFPDILVARLVEAELHQVNEDDPVDAQIFGQFAVGERDPARPLVHVADHDTRGHIPARAGLGAEALAHARNQLRDQIGELRLDRAIGGDDDRERLALQPEIVGRHLVGAALFVRLHHAADGERHPAPGHRRERSQRDGRGGETELGSADMSHGFHTMILYTQEAKSNPARTSIGLVRRSGVAAFQTREPETAEYRLIQKAEAAARAIPAPKGCTARALVRFPEAAVETAVVMPQVAQGFPRATAKAQGGSPSWVCVPWPAESGASAAPTASSVRHASATSAAYTRGWRSPQRPLDVRAFDRIPLIG